MLQRLLETRINDLDVLYEIYLVETYTKGRTATNMYTAQYNSAVK